MEESGKLASVDPAKIVDLDEEGDKEFMEMLVQGEGKDDVVLDLGEQTAATTKMNPLKKGMTKQERVLKEEEAAAFHKEYMRMGGIQHIVCSATLTINNQGRITPR